MNHFLRDIYRYHCDLSRCRNGRTIESEICGHYQTCINGKWHKRVCEDNRRFVDGYCQVKTFCNDDNDGSYFLFLFYHVMYYNVYG